MQQEDEVGERKGKGRVGDVTRVALVLVVRGKGHPKVTRSWRYTICVQLDKP